MSAQFKEPHQEVHTIPETSTPTNKQMVDTERKQANKSNNALNPAKLKAKDISSAV